MALVLTDWFMGIHIKLTLRVYVDIMKQTEKTRKEIDYAKERAYCVDRPA